MERATKASAAPVCDLLCSLLIFAQAPVFTGLVSDTASIYVMPWILAAIPFIAICVVFMIKQGDIIAAASNAVLSGVMLTQNAYKGLGALVYDVSGTAPALEAQLGGFCVDGMGFLVCGLVLAVVAVLLCYVDRIAAAGIGIGALGILSFSAFFFTLVWPLRIIGSVGLIVLAIYLFYSGFKGLLGPLIAQRKAGEAAGEDADKE